MSDRTRYSMNLDEEGNGSVLVADLETGDYEMYTSEHPDFCKVVEGATNNLTLEEIRNSMPDVEGLMKLSEHVTINDDGVVRYKGEPVNSSVADAISRFYNDGRPFESLVKFLERVERNPSRRSREQLYDWISVAGLQISEDGNVLGYKSVGGDYISVRRDGGAFVDGVWHEGGVPNRIGSVISMDRRMVQDDPNEECSHGLHVGTLTYARNYSGSVKLVVSVDPEKVVSVPTHDHSKMRVCEYKVIDVYDPQVDHEAPAKPEQSAVGRLGSIVPKSFLDRLREKVKEATTA